MFKRVTFSRVLVPLLFVVCVTTGTTLSTESEKIQTCSWNSWGTIGESRTYALPLEANLVLTSVREDVLPLQNMPVEIEDVPAAIAPEEMPEVAEQEIIETILAEEPNLPVAPIVVVPPEPAPVPTPPAPVPVVLPVPAPVPVEASTPASVGAAALAGIDYPWESLGYQIEFHASSPGFLGMTYPWEKRIVIHVRENMTVEEVRRVLAHELGHAVDVEWMTGQDQYDYKVARGIPVGSSWYGCDACRDFATPGGDYAETFAWYVLGPGKYASELGPPPTVQQMQQLERFFAPR